MPDVDEVDDVAEPQPVDQVADRAAEQQAERDRHVAGSRPDRAWYQTISPTTTERHDRRTASAWSRNSPNSAPVLWPWTIRTRSPMTRDRLARRGSTTSHAFASWSRTTTAIAMAENTPSGRDGRPSRRPPSRRRRRRSVAAPSGPRPVVRRDLASSALLVAGAAAQARRSPPASSATVAPWRRPVRRRRRRVGERLARHGREMRPRPRRRPSTQSSIRSSSVEPGLLAQVLDRPLQLAGVALGAERRRQLGVDDDDQAVVVRRPPCPGRGVAWISTSSAASVTPASVTRAVGVELEPRPRGRPP